jgi:EAL domain-containing protein (putative c-di-GMP-specific phosphodiesterase class I)
MRTDLDKLTPSASEDSSSFEVAWFLVGRLPNQESCRQIPVHSTPFQIGRSSATFCVPNNTVSSRHAEFHLEGPSLIVKDLGSTNGTFVNGRRICEPVALKPDDLVQFGSVPFRVMRQQATARLGTESKDVFDQAMLLVQFDKLISENAVIPYYQPIISLETGAIVGYEVLARSDITGLESPDAMFSAATSLSLQCKLSRMVRMKSIEEMRSIDNPLHLYLNTHPSELTEPGLIESMHALREVNPRQPMTLEIHEAAITDSGVLRELRAVLRDLEIDLAFDDFGSGQDRLAELTEVQPDVLKFDMSFIRDIDKGRSAKQQLVGALVDMARKLGVAALAEGVETEAEQRVCMALGFDLAQGYLFGRPSRLSW